ncbi:ROK family protein [Paraflavitalea sp. CAU 1676]|uniref:ROK family protein n=1 Tax=Paraflavitalea sp. CAU 1676 TaxID=3032598 RepID=UPI0023DB31C5|nr:ROK family protein [Paraflavitalea sp. CAU 1676]MDF2192906.1 ROK family protein [Paraflavitalea sp. CAU 1676]
MSEKQSLYRKSLIKHLYFSGKLSCAELSVLTDKSLPHTARALNDLLEEGVIVESGLATSTGGRRPQVYSMKADFMYVVSVAMDQFITHISILDMANQVVGNIERVELNLLTNPQAIKELAQHLVLYIQKEGIPKEKIAGIGIGMPGFVDGLKGVNYSFFNGNGSNIINYVEGVTGLPVMIDNDSSLIALAEWKLGIARQRQNAMVVNIGWGIGLGMILDGSLFRGENGFAGEFSHIPLFTNNKICNCGKTGCLETETSLQVITGKAIEGLQQGRISTMKGLSTERLEESSRIIMDAAANGDKYAIELISDAAYHIGRGIAILIHILNPGLIVLSGRGAIAGRLWLAPVQQALNEHCIPKIAENIEIKISPLGFNAERLGAASLIMEHFDELPMHRKTKSLQMVS